MPIDDNTALEIVREIGEMKADLKQDIGDIKSTIATFAEAHKNLEERVDTMESDSKSTSKLNKIFMICIAPVLSLAHQIAAHFKWIG